jgi:hypothetical protein
VVPELVERLGPQEHHHLAAIGAYLTRTPLDRQLGRDDRKVQEV